MLIEHYHPIPLPSIDDAKSPQVTQEVGLADSRLPWQPRHLYRPLQVIHLYKRIVDVFPEHGKGVLLLESVCDFMIWCM
jgi:hypothetical protein